jgi:hypothetical protein
VAIRFGKSGSLSPSHAQDFCGTKRRLNKQPELWSNDSGSVSSVELDITRRSGTRKNRHSRRPFQSNIDLNPHHRGTHTSMGPSSRIRRSVFAGPDRVNPTSRVLGCLRASRCTLKYSKTPATRQKSSGLDHVSRCSGFSSLLPRNVAVKIA